MMAKHIEVRMFYRKVLLEEFFSNHCQHVSLFAYKVRVENCN